MKIISILIFGSCLAYIFTINKQHRMRSHSIFYFINQKIYFKKLKLDKELVSVSDASKTKKKECTTLSNLASDIWCSNNCLLGSVLCTSGSNNFLKFKKYFILKK